RIERGETPPECFHARRQERRTVRIEDALAECEERRIGRATFAEKEPGPVQRDAPLPHLLEDPPLGPQRVEELELPPLNEVPPSEPVAHQAESLPAHRDAAHLDRAILESGLRTTELAERLPPDDQPSRAAVHEVDHVGLR